MTESIKHEDSIHNVRESAEPVDSSSPEVSESDITRADLELLAAQAQQLSYQAEVHLAKKKQAEIEQMKRDVNKAVIDRALGQNTAVIFDGIDSSLVADGIKKGDYGIEPAGGGIFQITAKSENSGLSYVIGYSPTESPDVFWSASRQDKTADKTTQLENDN